MIFFRALCIVFLLAATASAEGFPAHFGVIGVELDDRLNVRSEPNARSEIVDTYHPHQLNIEVMRASPDGKWGFVGTGESNGWVSLRFLERQNHLAAGEFPRPFHCSGTEPFWNLDFDIRGTSYSDLATGQNHQLETQKVELSHVGASISGGTAVLIQSATITRRLDFALLACSDGMSDREFAWSARLMTETQAGQSFETGCCSQDSTH